MHTFLSTLRRHLPAFTLATGVLLVAAFWVVGTHHHHDGTSHECAVCTTSHSVAPPVESAPHIAPAPEHDGHEFAPPLARGSQAESGATRARAPPVTA